MQNKLTPEERAAAERQLVELRGQIRSLINSDLPEDQLGTNWEDVLQESICLQRRLRE
jgi:hypothetical protein